MRCKFQNFFYAALTAGVVFSALKAEALFLSPTRTGLSGVVHVLTADNLGTGNWSFRVGANYINYRDFYNPALVNNTFRIVDTSLFVTTSLGPIGELAIGTYNRVGKFQPVGMPGASFMSGGNLRLALKMGYMTRGGVGAAVYALVDLVTERNTLNYDLLATSTGGGLIFSLDFWKMKQVPLRFHLNIGYYYDRREHLYNLGYYTGFMDYFYGIYHDDAIEGGVALEVPLKYVTPFIEYWTRQIIDADGDNDTNYNYDDSPQYISIGARVTPVRGFAIDVYYDQNLSDKLVGFFYRYPPWRIGLGISYSFLPRIPRVEYVTVQAKPPKKPEGIIAVKVVNAENAAPVQGAIIRFESKEIPAIATNEKGIAYVKNLPLDRMYKAEVYSQGYKRAFVRFRPVKEKKKLYLVKLKPEAPPTAIISGRVIDKKGRPVIAVIEFKNSRLGRIATNPETGRFRIEVPPGKHVIQVSAKGYETVTETVVVEKDWIAQIDIVLKKKAPPKPPKPIVPRKLPRRLR